MENITFRRCVMCGMAAFYLKGTTPLCQEHGKPKEMMIISTTDIRNAYRYWDEQRWCYVYTLKEIPSSWRHEAERVRLRVKLEYKGRILKCKVVQ